MKAPFLYYRTVHHLIGKTIDDRFEVVRLLGQGGMGAVFLAMQVKLDRPCALKVLLSSSFEVPTAKPRFLREARLAARVAHPNVVDIIDTGTDREGISYIAMEYIEGESLDTTLEREGPLLWERSRHIILQICRALEAAHACGVMHRDLKPANCMRMTLSGDSDFIKLVDFGIAKALQRAEKTKLTQANTPIGTVDYMAYEQACGEECDHRADVWAVGVILYELVSGWLPFRGSHSASPVQRIAAILHRDAIPLVSRVDVSTIPAGLPEVVHRALTKDRTQRYQTVEELRRAVEALPPLAERKQTVVAGDHLSPPEMSALTELHPSELVSDALGSAVARSASKVVVPDSPIERAEPSADAVPRPAEVSGVSATAAEPARGRERVLMLSALILLGVLAVIVVPLVARERGGDRAVARPEQQDVPRHAHIGPPPEPGSTGGPATTGPEEPADGSTGGTGGPPQEPAGSTGTGPLAVEPERPEPKKTTEPSKPLNAAQACAALKRQARAGIVGCIRDRTFSIDLGIDIAANGSITGVNVKNLILKNDPAFKCLDGLLQKQRIKNVAPAVTQFDCSFSKR